MYKERKYANETAVKKAVLARLRKEPSCYAYSTPHSRFGSAGIADITCILDGMYIAIECKTPEAYAKKDHNCTKIQLLFGEHVERANGQYWIISNLHDLEEHLNVIKQLS